MLSDFASNRWLGYGAALFGIAGATGLLKSIFTISGSLDPAATTWVELRNASDVIAGGLL